MELLRIIFPFSFGINDRRKFVVIMLGYIALGVISGIVFGLLGKLWAIGVFFRIAGGIVDLYAFIGAVLTIYNYYCAAYKRK